MTDWATISSLTTGGGTLVLAVATFASVRSANRSARIAELALQEQRRPVLTQSRLDDPEQKIMFMERRWVHVPGGGAAVDQSDGVIYMAASLRNVGAGIGVLQSWHVCAGMLTARPDHAPEDAHRRQTRDLYVPAGDLGLWQGALRDQDDPRYAEVEHCIAERDAITLELLYSDQVGGQRTITRFTLVPVAEDRWLTSVGRHWYLDRVGPR